MADTKAQWVRSRYEAAKRDSDVRVAKSQARREHYEKTGSTVPSTSDYQIVGTTEVSNKHNLRTNRAHVTAVKLVGRFMGELPSVRVVPRQENAKERWRGEALEMLLAGVYSESAALAELQSIAWHASVLGAGVARLTWQADKNMPRFYSVRPEHVFVKLATGDGTEWEYACYAAERTVDSVAAKYKRSPDDFTPDKVGEDGSTDYVTVIDYWDRDAHYVVAGGITLFSEKNKFGFIPYVIFKNLGPVEYVWGLSDQEFFEGLATYHDVLISQHADVIRLYANPPIHAKQTGLTANEILSIFRRGGVISTNKDNSDVRVVTSSGAPPEFQAQEARVRDLLQEATFSGPSGATLSGTAVQELRAAQDALLALKRANFEISLKKLNEYILRMVEKLGNGPISFEGVVTSGVRSRSFYMMLDSEFELPSEEEILEEASLDPTTIGLTDEQILSSRTPQDLNYRRLIDQHYTTRIIWNNRTAKEDPQYRLTLLNFFSQGAMSLRTMLEEVGVEDVEREVTRIKQEADEMPWLRPQMMQAMSQMNTGNDGTGKTDPGMGMFPTAGGGDPYDLASRELNGSERTSQPMGAVQGAPFGGA